MRNETNLGEKRPGYRSPGEILSSGDGDNPGKETIWSRCFGSSDDGQGETTESFNSGFELEPAGSSDAEETSSCLSSLFCIPSLPSLPNLSCFRGRSQYDKIPSGDEEKGQGSCLSGMFEKRQARDARVTPDPVSFESSDCCTEIIVGCCQALCNDMDGWMCCFIFLGCC